MKFLATALLLILLATCSHTPKVEPVPLEDWDRVTGDHHGEIAAVLVWATWCRPCLELFPEFVALQQREAYDNIAFLSVTLDEHDDPVAMAEALALVLQRDARFPHYVLRADVEQAMHRLGIVDVPAVLVLDREGAVRYRLTGDPFDNEVGIADVEDAIESLR